MTNIFIVYAAIVVFNICEGGVPPHKNERPRLKFLGTFEPTTVDSSTASSHYFISQNAAGWATAETDCRTFLGCTGSLVAIETEEEMEAVNKFLRDSDDTQSEFWLGGMYDVDTSSFRWNNNIPIAAWAPWDVGHPATSLPVTRISGQAVGNLKFRAKFNTESYRYMCELAV